MKFLEDCDTLEDNFGKYRHFCNSIIFFSTAFALSRRASTVNEEDNNAGSFAEPAPKRR
jgi:hypothetical protein